MQKANNESLTYLLEKYGMFLSVKAVCELLGVSRPVVDAMIQCGRLPVIKVGRQYKISCEDFLKWTEREIKLAQRQIIPA